MFLKRRHFGPGIPPQAGEGPKSAATGVMDDGGKSFFGGKNCCEGRMWKEGKWNKTSRSQMR